MNPATSHSFSPTLPTQLELTLPLDEETFWRLCRDNQNLQFERTATGELIIMPPTGGITGEQNAELIYQLQAWNRQTRLGKIFDSSTGFRLTNGAIRSPDVAWLPNETWETLSPEQKQGFVPLCPHFVIEFLSSSDILEKTRSKMQEYINNGTQLAWLIDSQNQQVEIYRPNQNPEVLASPTTLSGDSILPGLVLDLSPVFESEIS